MRKRRRNLLDFSNRMLSGALALLGFTSCIGGESPDEYGTPYAEYEIKGKVLDEKKEPMTGMRVIVKENPPATDSYYSGRKDTVYTGDTGEYLFKDDRAWPTMGYRVVCEDPDGVYKADSVDVEMKPEHGKGWYEGRDSKEVDFELKKKEE
ncbi:radical SAM-associated putative lipoprotein [uncultured Bacteroides sp.]|uniref:radical SAM-associated putative lipoprotein n=1 Tax=uncultured Bacteroides sp. TaxID=162156 RepID=UPI00280BB1D0|nr:radical SAM-associated putative lipoprotein [uncultured Bacteroides sp.]